MTSTDRVRASRRLRFSTDADPGIARSEPGAPFTYRGPSGRVLKSSRTLRRIEKLAIPPAWTRVWICHDEDGHIQATGFDAKGRKQYRYHSQWVRERDSNKFDSLLEFGERLPRIRRRVRADLTQRTSDKDRVLAAIVQLMDRIFIRVGDERYRRENGSFGATTLRNRHVTVRGADVALDFRGKSGKRHRIQLSDRKVASVIRRCLDLPGETVFQYRDGEALRTVGPADVNAYLQRVAGIAVTSKDFRTWGGSVCALDHLAAALPVESQSEAKASTRAAIKKAAAMLGNTAAVCRRSYVHPKVISSFERGQFPEPSRTGGLRAGERALLGLLIAARGDRQPPRVFRRTSREALGHDPLRAPR